jgi:DNA-binding response OmpR family regulator
MRDTVAQQGPRRGCNFSARAVSVMARPDIVLLDAEWPARALLRAQLAEEGYDVVAIDRWPIPRQYLRTDTKPRVMLIDLQGLPHPRDVLDDVRHLFPPAHVAVLASMATIPIDELRQLGFRVIPRPVTMREIVEVLAGMLKP